MELVWWDGCCCVGSGEEGSWLDSAREACMLWCCVSYGVPRKPSIKLHTLEEREVF